MQPELSIIILNWRSKDLLRDCIQSIKSETRNITFEVIVVDGASYDGAGEMLAQEHPDVRFFQLDENGGFAKGNNRAARHAQANTLLFLNPDTIVLDHAIEKLFAAFSRDETIGIAGLKLLNSDKSIQTSAVQPFPNISNQVLDFDLFLNTFPTFPLWGNAALYQNNPAPVQVISGACLMIQKELFEKVGGFNEAYFMYAEDAHLCWDARRLGFKVMYLPVGEVIHHGGGSSSGKKVSSFASRTFRHSVYLFLQRTRSPFYAELYRYSIWLCAVTRLSCLSVINLLRPNRVANSIEKWKNAMLWAQAPFKA